MRCLVHRLAYICLFSGHAWLQSLACSSESRTNTHTVASTTSSTRWLPLFFFFFVLFSFFQLCFFLFFLFSFILFPLHVPFPVSRPWLSFVIFHSFSILFRFSSDRFFPFFSRFVLICFFLVFFLSRMFSDFFSRAFYVIQTSILSILRTIRFVHVFISTCFFSSNHKTHTTTINRASMLSSNIYHIASQRIQPCTKRRSTHVPIRVRQRKQADRVDESQHVVEHLVCRSLCRRNQWRYRNLPSQKKTISTSSWWCAKHLVLICFQCQRDTSTTFFLYLYDACIRRPGYFSWSMELLAFASCQFAPSSGPPCPLHARCFVL